MGGVVNLMVVLRNQHGVVKSTSERNAVLSMIHDRIGVGVMHFLVPHGCSVQTLHTRARFPPLPYGGLIWREGQGI